jgi:SNF2-related domain/Helicase conserved C-terminal domain
MSLPPILRFVYNHGTDEVIRRGKKIFSTSGVQMLDADQYTEQIRFRVRNDLYNNFYTVTINKFLTTAELAVRCMCPYNLGEICRHEVAALFQLNEIIQSGFFDSSEIQYHQTHTVVRMRQITRQILQIFTSSDILENAEKLSNAKKAVILTKKNDSIEADVNDFDNTFRVTLKQNEERYFDTSCGCDEKKYPLCVHKVTLFLQVIKTLGPQYFQSVQNWEIQKNKLLEQYGYSLKDDLTNKFEFTYEGGKPFLKVLDKSIQKKTAPKPVTVEQPTAETEIATVAAREQKKLGIVLELSKQAYPYVEISLINGNTNELGTNFTDKVTKVEVTQFVNPLWQTQSNKDLIGLARKFHPEELIKYVKKNIPFSELITDFDALFQKQPTDEIKERSWEYLLPKYHKLFSRYSDNPLVFTKPAGKAFTMASLDKISLSDTFIHPQIIITKENDTYFSKLEWIIAQETVAGSDVTMWNAAIIKHENILYCINNLQELQVVEHFPKTGIIKTDVKKWDSFVVDKVLHWNNSVHIHFAEELTEYVTNVKPICRLYLQEREQMLVIKPVFVYSGIEIASALFGDILLPQNGIIKILQRNETAEAEYTQLLQTLHKEIHFNRKDFFFSVPERIVYANNWFSRFVNQIGDWNMELMGYETLKNFKINTNTINTQISVSSGIDWFDATVELKFGDQTVTITEIKKAILQKQNFVKLQDGSIGVLPEEWVKKYSLLLKMGETKGNKVKLKKYHFSVLDELLSELDEASMRNELVVKKEQLERIITADFTNLEPPEHLKAVLRPYQLAGFQWLKFLCESGWGGILADDMGLGKTIQTLTFFQHYKNTNPECRFLVVCPTTLMYNWENEIKKFTPQLTHIIHHGPKRRTSMATFEGFDIIITSYGTMRSDIKEFKEICFDFTVLDESQFIKNPQSQVAKASLLLNSKNRLALSGTPVQNNTFDLYAQMNFLNPGMLGSREFFMSEFATPIDKFREDEIKHQLKKLTYPFLLRRTKEQVAKDLPEKTETILYCEMGTEQRKIYEAYRNSYRSQILGIIAERGLERSQLNILQGLTKLRQICDSPAILNETVKYENHSVKLDELSREIMENVGDHKVLIFSQFIGMLGLIRSKLEHEHISHVYFDGSTSSTDREAAVQEFQNNHDCRVFLISLKAGGIGLNLTAADYVYIVDPWWNPAVEQQAIDRTHRIGQTKNIFAYRLICKDTLEEKMLLLQENKKNLAKDLVSDENTALKRLSKEDIEFLFS